MWLSDRRTFLTLLAAGLPLTAACGFTPAYAPGGPADGLRGRIRARAPENRDEFDLVERLEERLGRPDRALYALSYTITTDAPSLARTPNLRESRVQITGQARFELRRIGAPDQDGELLTSGTVSDFVGYSTTSTPLANRAAQEDARRRLMHLLAQRIATRLIATSADWTGGNLRNGDGAGDGA